MSGMFWGRLICRVINIEHEKPREKSMEDDVVCASILLLMMDGVSVRYSVRIRPPPSRLARACRCTRVDLPKMSVGRFSKQNKKTQILRNFQLFPPLFQLFSSYPPSKLNSKLPSILCHANMTSEVIPAVSRPVLKVRDVNQEPPSPAPTSTPTKTVRDTHAGVALPKMSTPVIREDDSSAVQESPFSPTDSEVEELGTPKERFEQVCKFRVAEDSSGELADYGIEEWSVEDFECLSKLGSGTAGTVYRARERISGYEVALKVQVYDPQDISSDVELDVHSELGEHPNVLRMIDYFHSDFPIGDMDELEHENEDEMDDGRKEFLYIILELCETGSLFDVIESHEGGWLDEPEAAQYFEGCLRGLNFLHEKDFIHCDVKTANFLVDENDVVKLADFGMTVRSDEKDILGGSPVFMAPEHLQAWRQGGEDFDHRVDIYGLGVTLFQMLVGDFPFYIIESDEDNKNADSLLACFGKLTLGDGPTGFDPNRLDLRRLDDKTSDEPFLMPEISFPDRLSDEARDLISRLMEPDADKRISIDEALDHVWFQCYM